MDSSASSMRIATSSRSCRRSRARPRSARSRRPRRRDKVGDMLAMGQALDLNFPLLSDWNADAVNAFGIAHRFRGYEDVAERTAFLVDSDGTVRGAWRYDTSEVPDFDALVAAARA